jgi:AcrR family transcriptional regulator
MRGGFPMPRTSSDGDGIERAGTKREAILQAAWSLIRHYGYNKTTMDDIAKRAGVAKGSLYLHFSSKAEIMLTLTDRTNERIDARLVELAATAAPPEERLRACLLHRVMALYDIVDRYPHSQDVIAKMMPEVVARLDHYVRRHGEILGRIVREGVEAGAFKTADPEEAGHLLADLFEFLTPPYYRFPDRESLETFANRVVDLALRGL